MSRGINWAAGFRIQPKKAAIYAVESALWPLKISPNGRSILRADGLPFYIWSDTAASMAAQLGTADVATYMADRSAKLQTAIWVSLIEHKFSDHSPLWKNANGDVPFSGTVGAELDFTTPVTAYWNHVDSIIQKALDYNILVLAFPAYLGSGMGDEGWATAVAANGTARMTTYGTFLGNRYKTFPNIMWVLGGDTPPNTPTDLTAHVNNLANAIRAVDPGHLMTAHNARFSSSFDGYNQSWLDVNGAYPDNVTVHKYSRLARQQAVKPTFVIESYFGNEHGMTNLGLRTEMYQGLLGGGVGHSYGQSPMWYFGVNASSSGNAFADTGGLDWHAQLNTFGSNFLPFAARLTIARPTLSLLTPDYAHTVVTAGYDTGGVEGVTYVPVMASSQMLIAYIGPGSASPITVNKATFASATFNVNWYNPRDGSTTSGGTTAMGSGTQVFTAPDANDWVLLLDDQALGLGNP